MDVPISFEVRRRRQRRRWFVVGTVGVLLAAVTLGLARLQPAAPLVEKSSIWMGTVRRGEMLRDVRGNGTLVPEDIRWIPSITAGRVEQILVLPGAAVRADTVLVELSNPQVEQSAFEAEWQLKAAEAESENLRFQLQTQKLGQQAAVATVQANCSNARLDCEVNEELARGGLVPELARKQSRTRFEELKRLLEIEQDRLAISADAARAQTAVQEAKVAQLRAQLELKRRQVGALKVRAGMDGVLQRLGDPANPLQVGQQLTEGMLVARVANPVKLKAAIRIAESQAKDVQLGQRADIDTRNGIVSGHVVRIDPAVENGTVTVDVAFDAALPKGARPDLSVDGTVELERLEDVTYVGRPVQAQAGGKTSLFKLINGGAAAVRVTAKLGRASVNSIEVIEGLQTGDQVILSDMSQWDGHDRVRLQ
jgi:HlyD family secretion protein